MEEPSFRATSHGKILRFFSVLEIQVFKNSGGCSSPIRRIPCWSWFLAWLQLFPLPLALFSLQLKTTITKLLQGLSWHNIALHCRPDPASMARTVSAGCRGHIEQTSRGTGRQDPQHPVPLPFLQGHDSLNEGRVFDFLDTFWGNVDLNAWVLPSKIRAGHSASGQEVPRVSHQHKGAFSASWNGR